MSNEVEMDKRTVFNADISSKLGDSINLPSMALPEFVEQDWDAEPMMMMKLGSHLNHLKLIW